LSDTRQRLRIDFGDWEGNTRYAEYDDFAVGSALRQYRLVSLGEYKGTAGQYDVKTLTELIWVVSSDGVSRHIQSGPAKVKPLTFRW